MSAKHFRVPLYQPLGERLEHFFDTGESSDIPVLNKHEIVSGFPGNFMTEAMRQGIEAGTVEFANTSGSSLQILQVIRLKGWWNREFTSAYAYMEDMAGFSIGHDKKALLISVSCSAAACFLENPDYHERIHNGVLSLNTFPDPTRWTATDIRRIDAELRTYAPKILEINPTYLAIFLAKRAEYQIDEALYLPDYITTSYEFMTANTRRLIETAYGRPVLSMYGSTELGLLFMQNRIGTFVRCGHETMIELKPHIPERNIFELIITSWKNPLMPLLRYATGDLVEVAGGNWSGHTFMESEEVPLLKLHGRIKDSMISTEGRIRTMADLDSVMTACAPGVRQYQLQITDAHVTLFYVPSAPDEIDSAAMYDFLSQWFGPRSVIKLLPTPSIAPEPSGKFAIIKQSRL
jgi:phenylacetate-CoA ligase